MRVVVSGYFGFDNLGDEAILSAMLAALRPRLPGASFVALSGDPASTERQHGIAAVPRIGPGALRAVAGADLLLSGGGSLIQDVTSARSALYYLGMLRAGRGLARRAMMYAQGIGPIDRPWLRTLTGWVCSGVDVLTVRDEDSRRLLQSCGVRRPIEVVADPAFALEAAPPDRAVALLGAARGPRIGVAVRPWGDNAYLAPLLAGLRQLREQVGGEIILLVFHRTKDEALSARAASELGGRVISGVAPDEMLAVIGAMDLVVGARLHALICAVAAGVAPVAVGYDPKVEALVRRTGIGALPPVGSLTASATARTLSAAWSAKEETRASLRAQGPALKAAALRAADLAAALAGNLSKSTE
ncbi:MAG TPA: polysaccharide pyruvyl transferase CsaB [bacterium]|jgi:polysaccharide pyruvyl transferase CsaB|nr:polysaccharide pyruvyl transferase CsaB [bacterium]